MAEYLNLDGLKTLWTKAKNTFVPKTRKINGKELSSDVNLVLGDIVPIVSKTFSNVIGSAADQANANFFFGKLTPSDKSVYVQCRARYRLYAWIHDASKIPSTDTNKTNNVYTRGWFDVEINVRGETLVVYKVWNNHSSTSYKTITYHELGRAKSATIQAGGGHILGVRTRDAYSPIATGWNRDYRIDILELENCTFEFFDEMKKHSVAYTSDFVALSEIDGTNNGLRESGDDNDTSTIYSSSTGYVVGTNGMQQYSLCAIDKDGKLQSFTKTAGTGTTKTVNDAKFKFPLVLYRYNQSTSRANGYYFKDNWIQKIVASFDARYSCNRGTVFNPNAGPVYLEGTIDDDGYFSVSSNILTQTFSEGKVYVHVGNPYNASAAATNVYNINLDATHPAYYYDGTNLVPYEEGRYAKKTELASKQDTLAAQTAYSAKGSATKVPKITTNALGQVTNIEEVTITQPDVSGKADDTAVVHLSGTETVTGVKTFSNSTTNIVNPQATDITRFRVFKPGETNLNGGVRLQLEYDPDGGRGLWDSNISENDGNVLWIDAYGQVRLYGAANYASRYADFLGHDSGVAITDALPSFFSKEFGLIYLSALRESKVANLFKVSVQQAGFLFWTVQLEDVPVNMVITFTVLKSNRAWEGGEEHSSASLYVKSGNSTVSFITQYSYNVDDSGNRWYYLTALPRSSYSGSISCKATCFRLTGAVQRFGGPWG